MKKAKKFTALAVTLTLALSLFGCGGNNNQSAEQKPAEQKPAAAEPAAKEALNIAAMSGPTGMGLVKLMDDAAAGTTAVDYQVNIVGAADEITGKIINGEVDIAAVPCNLASVLYNKTEGKIKVAAINTLGVLYVLENGEEIQSVADLKGKTIVSTGKGTTPEYTLNYILTANGLDPATDVDIQYKSEAAEIAAAFQSGEATIAMVPQPVATTIMVQNENVRQALDITEEFAKAQGEDAKQLVTGTIIVRADVLENKKAAVDAFLDDYAASIAYVNDNVAEAAALIEKYGIVAKAAVAQQALPSCNIVFIDGEDMQANIENYLNVLFAANPASVGGQMPDEAFYYKR